MLARRLVWLGCLLFLLVAVAPVRSEVPDQILYNGNWYRNGATLDLDFYNNRYWLNGTSYFFINDSLNGAGTFTRSDSSTNATYFDNTGTLQTAASGVVRTNYTYNGSSWVNAGTMLEEGRTNYITYSAQVGSFYGTQSAITVTNNSTTALDGNTTATQVLETSATADHYLEKHSVSISSNQVFSYSAYIKPIGSRHTFWLKLYANSYADNINASCDTTAVTATATNGGMGHVFKTTIQALPSGWYYCSVTGQPTAASVTDTTPRIQIVNAATTYAGDPTQGMYVWGAQLEVGYFPTSLIQTSGATATRAAESFSGFSRSGSGTATYFDSAGTVQVANTNAPRRDYDPMTHVSRGLLVEESRTNSISNNMLVGSAVSSSTELTTSGTFSGCLGSTCTGWTTTVNGGTGSVSYTSGTATLTGDGTNAASIYQAITTVAGYRYTIAVTADQAVSVQAGTAAGGSSLNSVTSTGGTSPAYFQFTATTTTSYVQVNNTSTTPANVTVVSVQSAGRFPTNWFVADNNGTWNNIYSKVTGVGTSNGFSYVDLNFLGTSSAAGQNFALKMNSTSTSVAASNGQTWTYSSYVALSSGSLSGISPSMTIDQYTSTPSYISGVGSYTIAPTSTLTRYVTIGTTNSASTAYIQPVIYFTFGSGTVINATIRVAAPQLELGSFPTSIIPTTTAAVTRGADAMTIGTTASGPNGAWYTAGIGTLGATAMTPYIDSGNAHRLASINDAGAQDNRVGLSFSNGSNKGYMFNAAALTYSNVAGSLTANTPMKGIITYSGAGRVLCAFVGTLCPAGSGLTIPSFTQLNVGSDYGNLSLDGWVNRIWYMPTLQPDASLPDYTR